MILNPESERGDYKFDGDCDPSKRTSLLYSDKEIQQIVDQINNFTTVPRDYIITLKNDKGEQVYAMDNLSLTDLDDLVAEGQTPKQISDQNTYTLFSEGELPIS